MAYKRAILTLLAVALLLGVGVSGCNRGRNQTAMVPAPRRASSPARSNGRASRPAEVLSASVSRPPERQYVAPAPMVAQAPQPQYRVQPLPQSASVRYEPVVLAQGPALAAPLMVPGQYPQPVYSQTPVVQTYSSPPVYQQAPIHSQSAYALAPAEPNRAPRAYHPTPELAMARASLPDSGGGARPPTTQVRLAPTPAPVQVPVAAYAPIPELEPVRYQRVPEAVSSSRPVAELMMTSGSREADPAEVRRALAPLQGSASVAPSAVQGWVASPTTAMR